MSQQQPTTATATYVGCFKEEIRSPDLDGEPPLSITRAEACFTHCSIGTWSFAGIRNGTICTCGDSEQRKYGSAPESSCSTKCPETQSAFDDCGGTEANSVYFVGAMTPKVPWPTPSVVNPTAILPSTTPPSSDDGNGNGGGGGDRNNVLRNTKHSSTAVIASVAAVAGVAVLAIATLLVHRRKKGRRSMSSMEDGTGSSRFERHASKDKDTNAAVEGGIDPFSYTRAGHSWFVSGHRDLDLDDNDSIDDNEDQSDDGTGRRKEYLSRSSSKKKEHHDLFMGFESSAMDEDNSSRSIHPSEHLSIVEAAPNTVIPPADGPTVPHNESAITTSNVPSASTSASTTTTAFPLGQPSKTSFATKIGLKMGHLKVKVPTPNTTTATTEGSSVTMQHAPISPISPTSRSSSASSTTAPAFNDYSTTTTTTRYLDIEAGPASHYSERSPTSATPSFSLASAPVPGQASNIQEAKKANNYKHQYHHHDPPSPISPQKPTIPSPTSSRQPSTTYPQKSCQGSSSRHQKKQHRSDLIKDLILQGDSALEDKELALMAQYQPHHCWQQQQHVTQQAAVAAAAVSAPSKAAARRASLEPAEKSPTTATMAPAAPALIIPSPRDYLAPPPRILVHKAL
ncbi:Asialoglycoprotein receptor 1 [Mortierella sp. 14UC]|nr:Asialoglycoprotein receptor 1 [Mortierella sp. 14UC]